MLLPAGPPDAKLMIVTECVSNRDLISNTMFGDREFDKMLSEAGGIRSKCFITALIKEQVYGQTFEAQVATSKGATTPRHKPLHSKMVLPCVVDGLRSLERDIDLVRPKVVLLVGNGGLFALTGKWGIKAWRSSIIDYVSPGGHRCVLVPTYTPNYIYGVWKDRNIAIHDIRKAWNLAHQAEPIVPPKYDFIIQPDFGTVARTLKMLIARADAGPLKLAHDIETRGGHIACDGLAWSATEAICIPYLKAGIDPSKYNYWGELEEAFIMHLMYRLLTHPNVEVVGQNYLYDAQYYHRWFHYVPNFKRDTMIAQHSMFSSMQKGLDFLSSIYCKHHVYWKDESKNWDPKMGERQLWVYNCKDCCSTWEIDEVEQQTIDQFTETTWPQLRDIHDFQQSLFWPVLDTMITGIRVDNDNKGSLSQKLQAAIDERTAWITEAVGYELNIKSPKQMQDFFYRQCNQREIKNRKTGGITCDDSALAKIATREPLLKPLCDRISDLRSLGVFRSTFLEAPVDIDQRMRCSFNITGTETYRFSSSENAFGSGMNLQNVPSGDEASGLPNIRGLFLPDEGMEFFDIDLDSADLRIVVWESDCTEMKAMFAEGKKPYVEVAKEYYRDPTITKHHSSYKLFKALCHGTNYLGTPAGLAGRIGLEVVEVERIQKWYYEKFPQIKTWQEDLIARLHSNRYVENVFGYRIWFFDRLEGTVANQAVAAVPQSTVACLINRGYKNIKDKETDIKVLLQVHDSLAGQYPIASRDQCIQRVIDHCTVPLPYSTPLVIPVGVKTSRLSWGECD